jgi:hypothetical protein
MVKYSHLISALENFKQGEVYNIPISFNNPENVVGNVSITSENDNIIINFSIKEGKTFKYMNARIYPDGNGGYVVDGTGVEEYNQNNSQTTEEPTLSANTFHRYTVVSVTAKNGKIVESVYADTFTNLKNPTHKELSTLKAGTFVSTVNGFNKTGVATPNLSSEEQFNLTTKIIAVCGANHRNCEQFREKLETRL